MNPEIKYLVSPDIPDLEKYYQEEGSSFCFLIQIIAGPENSKGEESFDILVCSPEYLSKKLGTRDVISGRNYIIMKEYRYNDLYNFIRKYLNHCEASTWDECAKKLGRLGKWEFEDYKELK